MTRHERGPARRGSRAPSRWPGSSSGGARKICTVPRTKRKNVKPIHFHCRGHAPNAVRKTSSSAGWMIAKPRKPCASSAPSPAPLTYAVMRYACRKTPSDDQARQHEVDPQECSFHGARAYGTGRIASSREAARHRRDGLPRLASSFGCGRTRRRSAWRCVTRAAVRAALRARAAGRRHPHGLPAGRAGRVTRSTSTVRENVARAAAAVGARLVHLSTDVVFDGRKGARVRRAR